MVDIVIVNWNSGQYLRKCILSIERSQKRYLISKVIVVDNNSADSSVDFLKEYQDVLLIKNTQNNGFAKACNQGFKLCTNEFVLLLNPDAMVLENTIEECMVYMNRNNQIDILGCALIDEAGNLTKSCARFPTPIRIFFDASGLSKIAPSIFKPATLMTDWNHAESKRVDQVMGAFMFMRTNLFKRVGYFDERFFVYYEELDFSYRLFKINGISYYEPAIRAVHAGEGTTSSVKAFRLYLSLSSRLKYAKKHFAYNSYLFILIFTFPIEFISRFLFLIVSLRFSEIHQVIRGYLMFLKNSDVSKNIN